MFEIENKPKKKKKNTLNWPPFAIPLRIEQHKFQNNFSISEIAYKQIELQFFLFKIIIYEYYNNPSMTLKTLNRPHV
jgi:hypothetical protein